MNEEKFETGLEYAPEVELFIPEENNPKRLYRARFEFLGHPTVFPTRTNNQREAIERTLRHLKWEYIRATNPPSPEGLSDNETDDRAQDLFDRELGRAFGKVRNRSELELLGGILDGMVKHQLRTYESTEAFLKARAYLDEKDAAEKRRKDELRPEA